MLSTGEIYHIFNKSVSGEEPFSSKRYLNKILSIAEFYMVPQSIRLSKFNTLSSEIKHGYSQRSRQLKPLVEIYAYAFMPNHYHFLLKQLTDRGISIFISNLQNSFAKYYNLKNNRHGSLFLNPFKAKRIETDEQMIHVSRYIHLNPVTAFIIEYEDLPKYPWTSFPVYADDILKEKTFIKAEVIEGLVGRKQNYVTFVEDQVKYQRDLATIKHLSID